MILSLWCCLACYLQPCDHLLGKGLPVGSLECCVLLCLCHIPICFHIKIKGGVGTVKHFKPYRIFYWPFQAVFFWILFVILMSCCPFLLYFLICSLQPCDHLLGKGWPLGSFPYGVPDQVWYLIYRFLIFAFLFYFDLIVVHLSFGRQRAQSIQFRT